MQEHVSSPETPEASLDVIAGFVSACGLRKADLARLRVEDVWQEEDERSVFVNVNDPDGIPIYEVPVLWGQESAVLLVVKNRKPEELVFPHLPQKLNLQRYRIRYARALYKEVCIYNELGYNEWQIVEYVMHALCLENSHELVRRYYLGYPS